MSDASNAPGVLGSDEERRRRMRAVCEHGRLRRKCDECDLSEEVAELKELLRTAHVAALQGGWNTSDPDDRADMAKIREALR